MMPNLVVQVLKGMLRSGTGESTCNVANRVAGEGRAVYYTSASIVDDTVSPRLGDGDYEFRYADEPEGNYAAVSRKEGFWLNVPASSRTPKVA